MSACFETEGGGTFPAEPTPSNKHPLIQRNGGDEVLIRLGLQVLTWQVCVGVCPLFTHRRPV